MNHQGWPCSTKCKGSQFGRGGTFIGLPSAALHGSLSARLKLVCACDGGRSQTSRRFCNFGCFHKNTAGWSPASPVAQQSTSAWDAVAWTGA